MVSQGLYDALDLLANDLPIQPTRSDLVRVGLMNLGLATTHEVCALIRRDTGPNVVKVTFSLYPAELSDVERMRDGLPLRPSRSDVLRAALVAVHRIDQRRLVDSLNQLIDANRTGAASATDIEAVAHSLGVTVDDALTMAARLISIVGEADARRMLASEEDTDPVLCNARRDARRAFFTLMACETEVERLRRVTAYIRRASAAAARRPQDPDPGGVQ